MVKKLLCIFGVVCSINAQAQITETATDAVKNMGVGWNLGNTLDANIAKGKNPSDQTYWNTQGLDSETSWGQAATKNKFIKMMKDAGFGAIRVPVTWYNHMDADGKVNAEWMKRVKEVVDYVIDNGMYCIINVHHDNGADNDNRISWIKADADNYKSNQARYENLWKQIAETFKDYDKHLVFEGYNEMLDANNSWCFAGFKGEYKTESVTSAYNGLNGYAQSFVTAVRATGGNNSTRNLILNTYAAANGYGDWNTHLQEPLTKMLKPTDSATDHLIYEVHDYPQIAGRSLTDIKKQIDGTISVLKSKLPSGCPVIIGEWGTNNVDAGEGKTDYDLRRELMFEFANYYVKACKSNGIATFYWMGLSDGSYRDMCVFNQPDLAKTIVKAYRGNDFEGVYPVLEVSEDSYVIFEGDKMISNWSVQTLIKGSDFKIVGEGAQLEITYTQESGQDDIQLYYGDWSDKPKFTVDGTVFTGDLNPGKYYGTPTGTQHTTVFKFDADTYKNLCSKGLVVFGDGWRMLKVRLISPASTGITRHTSTVTNQASTYYTLSGQRVSTPTRGIYIKGGKKVFVE